MASKNKLFNLLFVALLVISCTKEDEPTPLALINNQVPGSPQLPPFSSFSGQEFLFENLSWQYYHSGGGSPWWDEIYLSTAAADAFTNATAYFNNSLSVEVFVKLDTTSNWIKVLPDSQYDFLLSVQYTYMVYSPHLVVNVWPLDHSLVGRKAAIKVKFL